MGLLEAIFHSTRGLCQRDPISPIFFLCADILSRSIDNLQSTINAFSFKEPRGAPLISHLS